MNIKPLFTPAIRDGFECQYRVPRLLVSPRGTIFAFPEERQNGMTDETKTSAVMRRSTDHGLTWGDIEVIKHDSNPRVSYGISSCVADAEKGRVVVFLGRSVVILSSDIGGAWPEQWKEENPEERIALEKKIAPGIDPGRFVMWTDDDGETWSEPKALGDCLFVVNPVTQEKREFGPQFSGIQLQRGKNKGRLICPGRGFTKGKPFGLFAYSHNYVVYSDDHGETWQPGGLAQNGTGEACVVELADGTVYLNSRNESLRCRGYRAWDRSGDGGENFLESGYDLQLPEPHCAASIVRYSGLPDQESRILFFNPAVFSDTSGHYDHAGRRNLTVRMSLDECKSWPVSRIVYEGPAGYSAIAAPQDGSILCAFETLTETGYSGTILLARFDLNWLTVL